jgi:CDP-diglyceride synthetase
VVTVATAVCAGVWMFGFLVPWPRNSEGDPPHGVAVLVYLTTLIYLFVLAMTLWLGGAVLVESWLKRRSGGGRARRGDGQQGMRALRFLHHAGGEAP